MGLVTMGPDFRIVEFIKNNYQIESFIETGTFTGGTTEWASSIFKNVYSIEFSAYWYNHTGERLKDLSNVHILYGDTKTTLPTILPKVNNAILWLDAHWCGDHSFGEDDQCPLLEEIQIINNFDGLFDKLFILIDDARLFLTPPPIPHSLKDYPDLSEVMDALTTKRKIYVFNDIILAVPKKYADEFNAFLQVLTTEDAAKVEPIALGLKQQIWLKIKSKMARLIGISK